jgi:ribosomal protein S12 methylthiotransferase accessory factor
LYFDYPTSPGEPVCVPVSNGVAAGNSIEEAVLHALLELIERDCVAVWWYNRLERPAVDWSEALGSYGRELTEQYRSIGREWWALDVTHDLGVPCVAAVTARADPPHGDVLAGFGAHPDATVALRRAVSEMNQVLAVRTATRVARFGPHFERWVRDATVEAHPYLRPHGVSPLAAARVAVARSGDLLDDIAWCRELLEQRGMEVLVLDQTRPDIDVPVVRVVVPPLRHFRARFAPGRLYTVPVTQGWRATALAESALNPVPFPF